jgi:hypothetical protein
LGKTAAPSAAAQACGDQVVIIDIIKLYSIPRGTVQTFCFGSFWGLLLYCFSLMPM